MLKKFFFAILLFLLAGVIFLAVLSSSQTARDRFLTLVLNQAAAEYFDQSIRTQGFRLDKTGRMYLDRFQGSLKTEEGAIPLQVSSIYSESAVTDLFSEKGLLLNFREARPSYSLAKGVRGQFRIRAGKEGFMELTAEVESLNLNDLVRFQPDFLSGSEGELKGEIVLKMDSQKEPSLTANLRVEKPGGRIQSRFFDGVTPYLPVSRQKQILTKLSRETQLVDFENADLNVDLLQSDKIKVFLHILIPDYNLNLNLNMEIRIDEKNALSQLFRVMGILKIKASS